MFNLIKPAFNHHALLGIRKAARKHLCSNPYAFKSYSDRFVKNTSATKSYFSWLPNFGTILASILPFVGVGGASYYLNKQNSSSQTANTLNTTQAKKQETVQERKETLTAPVYNCSYAPEKPIKKEKKEEKEEEKEIKNESSEYCCNAGTSSSDIKHSQPISKKLTIDVIDDEEESEEHKPETPRVVKAKPIIFKGPLSMEPTEFIDEIWKEFIKTKDIRKFLSQPKVLNRLAANRNKKIREYFQKKAKDDLAEDLKKDKTINYCMRFKEYDHSVGTTVIKKFQKLEIKDIKYIFNKRVAELDFATVPTLKISPKTEGPNGEYVPDTNIVRIYETDNTCKTIGTIFHELTHAKQHEFVNKYFNTNKDNIKFKKEEIENLKKLSQDDKIRLLAMLLAQCQYDYTFTNGCDPQKTVQLCDYKNLNDEVEASAYGEEAASLVF